MRLRRVCHAEARLAQPGSPKPWTTKFVVSSCIMSTNAPYQPAPEGQQGHARSTGVAGESKASPNLAASAKMQMDAVQHDPQAAVEAGGDILARAPPPSFLSRRRADPPQPATCAPTSPTGPTDAGGAGTDGHPGCQGDGAHDLSGLAMLAAPHWLNQSMMAGSKRASITNKETANKMGGSKESGDDERRLMSQWVTADGCCAARQPPRRFVGWCRRPS